MKKIDPIRLRGNWLDGYAMSLHTFHSNYLGINEHGYEHFDTKRTYLGQLLYELKYGRNKSKVNEIINLISPFLVDWNIVNKIDYIIPAPPSKARSFQPVYILSEMISQFLKKKVLYEVIQKDSSTQSKNLLTNRKDEITESIFKKKMFNRKVNILLIDDLYQSGKTLTESTKVLMDDFNVNNVYVLTMTKTRR